jgi:hypothetical protein
MTVFDLSPHGPYTPEDTLAAADAVAEAVRLINHATLDADGGGLELPGDAYTLLGRLERAAAALGRATTGLAEAQAAAAPLHARP